MEERSYFDGKLSQMIGWRILGTIVTALTLGICFPWALCMLYKWEAKHTVIDGDRLYFDGSAFQLVGQWIKWVFLTLITFGIYGWWLPIKFAKWKTKHTHRIIAEKPQPVTNTININYGPAETKPEVTVQQPSTSQPENTVNASQPENTVNTTV